MLISLSVFSWTCLAAAIKPRGHYSRHGCELKGIKWTPNDLWWEFFFKGSLIFEIKLKKKTSFPVGRFFCADGGDDSVKVNEEEEVREYRVKCLNNLAATQLKLEQYEEALNTSRDVLTLEQNNVKALFRTGKVGMESAAIVHTNSMRVWVLIRSREAVPGLRFGVGFICSLLCCGFWCLQRLLTAFRFSAPVRQGWIQRGHGDAEKGLETGAYHQGEIVWGTLHLFQLHPSVP